MIESKGRSAAPTRLISVGRHLIYSEGTKTEPLYVESFSKRINNSNNRGEGLFQTKYKSSAHTIDLIHRAEKDVQKRMKKGETIDCVWIFFDKDSFDDFDKACQLIEDKNNKEHRNAFGELADSNNITWHSCWSNECFELWIYLHFENLESAISRKLYIDKINKFIRTKGFKNETYSKNKKDLLKFLVKVNASFELADRLAENKDPGEGKIKPNPSTGIYNFQKRFLKYIDLNHLE